MAYRTYNFPIASGATATSKIFVGNHEKCWLVVSGLTQMASGTNNETIAIRGGLSTTDTHADITSMTVTTFTVKGVYPMPHAGLPNMSIGFTTAVTSAGSVDVVVYSSNL